jgi:repressor LexA
MANFAERLRALRINFGLSQQKLADKLGGVSKSSINMYERGEREPGLEMMEAIADFFNVDLDYLYGKSDTPNRLKAGTALPSNIIPMPEMRQLPLIGTIACGTPITAEQNVEDLVDIPKHIHADFALRCKGDSMINARIFDGDIVYIRQQPTVENGEIAAVLIEDEATLKRFRRLADRIILEPANPLFDSLVYRGSEMEQVHILGRAVAFTSNVR